MTPTVYLAGPITGSTYAGATDWREGARRELAKGGIVGLSPMRGKDYLLADTSIKDSYAAHVLSAMPGITTRDRFDVMRCDIVLLNVADAERVSIGSCIEIGWADAYRKPLILVASEGNAHWHAMVRQIAGFIVPTLDEALGVCKAVLSCS
jgi:nucleoside 2-deoxyribosyltransferase